MTSCCYDLQRQPLQALLQDISPLKDSKMVNGGSSFADCSPLAFFRLEKLLGLVSSSSSCITHRPLLSHNWTLLGGAAIRFVFSLLHRCANRNGSLIDSPFQACSIPTFQVFILAGGIVVLHRAQRITTVWCTCKLAIF